MMETCSNRRLKMYTYLFRQCSSQYQFQKIRYPRDLYAFLPLVPCATIPGSIPSRLENTAISKTPNGVSFGWEPRRFWINFTSHSSVYRAPRKLARLTKCLNLLSVSLSSMRGRLSGRTGREEVVSSKSSPPEWRKLRSQHSAPHAI